MKVQRSGYLDLTFFVVKQNFCFKRLETGTSLEAYELFLCVNNSGYFLPGAMQVCVNAQW